MSRRRCLQSSLAALAIAVPPWHPPGLATLT
jgi:hypothetical protein